MSYLSAQLKKARKKRGLSQAEFSKLIYPPVNHTVIWAWENEKTEPSPCYMKSLAELTGISAVKLIKGGHHK